MNQSSLNSSLFNPEFQKLNHDYLNVLHQKQQKLQQTLSMRKQQKKKATQLYQDYVRRQMQMLLKEKENMSERNQKFLAESKKYSVEIKKVLPQMIEKETQLKERKLDYVTYLDKIVRKKGASYMKTVSVGVGERKSPYLVKEDQES